jgi:flagellar biosynthesis protein FlhG
MAGKSTGRHTHDLGQGRQAAHRGQVLAVTSGKGGVGKSNIAAGLSILLSAAGCEVVLVDADFGLGSLDVLMGVCGGPSLADVSAGKKKLQDVLVRLPSGVHLAAGDAAPTAHTSSRPRRHDLIEGLPWLRKDRDFVILDCGSGIGPDVMELCALADHVVVVTTPEPTALADAYAVIKILSAGKHPGRISVLVNMVASRDEAKSTYARLAMVARQFLGRTVFDAGYVRADPKVSQAVKARQPFVLAFPRSGASRCLTALAVKLQPRKVASRHGGLGVVLQKIAEWFG